MGFDFSSLNFHKKSKKGISTDFTADQPNVLPDLNVDGASEGAPAPFVLGQSVRVEGEVIWLSDVRQSVTGGETSKKGHTGAQVVITYYADIAIAFARAITEGPNPVRQIYLGGEKIFDASVAFDVTSDDISVNTIQQNQTLGTQPDSPTCEDIVQEHLIEYVDSGATVANLFSGFRTGADVAVSGSTQAANNGTFRVTKVELDAGGVVGKSRITVRKCQFTYQVVNPDPPVGASVCTLLSSCSPGVTVSEVTEDPVRFVQDSTDFGKFNADFIGSVTQYTGAQSQTPDPTIEAALGVGNTQAFRGTTYVVLKNLNITRWASGIPPSSGVVRESSTRTVGEAIAILLKRTRSIVDANIDVTGLTDIVRGFVVRGPESPIEALTQFMFVYGIDEREEASIGAGGSFDVKLKFFKRSSPDLVLVSDGDRGAHAFGQEPEMRLMETTQTDESRLPSAVTIGFTDADNDLQVGARTFHGETQTEENNEDFEVSIVLTATEAEDLARIAYWSLYFREQDTKRVDLPPVYDDITEGDNLTVNDSAGNPVKLRVLEVTVGANGLVRVGGYSEFVDLQALTSFGSPSGSGTKNVRLPPELRLCAQELPCMSPDGDPSKVGIWFGTGPLSPQVEFETAGIFESIDSTSWTRIRDFTVASVLGVTVGKLGGGVTGTFWDEENTLTVILDDDDFEPSTTSDQQVFGAEVSWVLVGREIVGFVNATKTASRTFALTRLLRGRRNTEDWIDNHATGEKVLFLKTGEVAFHELGQNAIGIESIFRVVPFGGSLVDAVANQETRIISGTSIKPFGPTVTTRSRKDPSPGDGTFRIRWRRRTQVPFRMLSGVEPPLHEEGFERYQILISDAGVVVRTIFIGDRTFYNYSVAKQVADFGSEQFSLTFSIYQMAPGRPGLITTATIT